MGVHIETYPVDKEYTDLQLTLRRIGETYSSPEVVLTGCWGGRLDHTWSNIFLPYGLKTGVFIFEASVTTRKRSLFFREQSRFLSVLIDPNQR